MPVIRRAIIVGAGIGGLAAAVALRRAGVEVQVYEQRPTPAALQSGGGLVMWHNAVLALHRLGLAAGLADIGHEIRQHSFRSAQGRRLASWPMGTVSAQVGVPAYAVSRPVLHELLLSAAGDAVRYDARCTGFRADDDGVRVRFAGAPPAEADVLIGADGLRSAVRRELRPYEPPPRFAGFTAWHGVVGFADRAVPDGVLTNMWGRGLRFLHFRVDGGDRVYWEALTTDRIGHRMDTLSRSRKEIVAEQFAGWPEPALRLVAATPEAGITTTDGFDRVPVRSWSTGRVTLLGDAAHPMTFNLGQGACQAIEDAVVLADALEHGPSAAAALAEYQRRRRDRTAKVAQTSRRIGAIGRWSGRLACGTREAFMRTAFDGPVFRRTVRLMMNVDFPT
jgi:2-polyprenyl-6-methoxyphenol hydroxylase-like FAD-dependent oxidoreductase